MGRTRKPVVRVALLLVVLAAATRASANVNVSIQYDVEERLELARRLSSELESEGYTVEVKAGAEVVPCDSGDAAGDGQGTRAWIRLKADPSNDGTVVASICYLGALPLLQQASSKAPSSDPHQLALATAEALNGLRSRLRPVVGDSPPAVRRDEVSREEPELDKTPSSDRTTSVALGMTFVVGLPDFPVAAGADLRATLGLASFAGLAIDVFVPTSAAELESPEMTASVRTAWARIGPRFGGQLGEFHLSGAALAGPALTWATAVARAPRVGTTDLTTSALLTLSALAEFPSTGPIFASAAASASLLLPGIKVNLGESVPDPRSSWPLEASIGLGARWGSR